MSDFLVYALFLAACLESRLSASPDPVCYTDNDGHKAAESLARTVISPHVHKPVMLKMLAGL